MHRMDFGLPDLSLDCEDTVATITAMLRKQLAASHREGFVVSLSGELDSSVLAALCVRAVGPDRVFGLHLLERESARKTIELSWSVSERFGFDSVVEEISETLDAFGCRQRYDAAVRTVIPGYGHGWRSEVVLPEVGRDDRLWLHSIVAEDPLGDRSRHALTQDAYREIVAATIRCGQRVRQLFECYHADRLNYVVAGTPDRLEYDRGFFVRLGDGPSDVRPITHLYMSQVLALAEHLGVPDAVREQSFRTELGTSVPEMEPRPMTSPHLLDLCLYAHDHEIPPQQLAAAAGLDPQDIQVVMMDIEHKRRVHHDVPPAPAAPQQELVTT